MKARGWATEKLYYDQGRYFDDLLEGLDQAKHSIELETYILDHDSVGKRVLEHLKRAASRGVRVRLLIDGVGAWFSREKIQESLQGTRVELRVYHPFRFFGFVFSQFNKRLHRKMCILDHRVVFVGSFNVTNLAHRDTGVRVEGGPVWILHHAFERVWNHRFRSSNSGGDPRVRLNENKRLRRSSNRELVRRMREAKRRIWITNAYFVPPFFLLRSLCLSALRGVEVKLLLPAKPDHVYMKWLSEAFYRTLLSSGVAVFEYQGSFLHAKSILVDDWVMVGSTNLNHRSLIHDLEVDVVLSRPESRISLEEQFKKDLSQSQEIRLGAEPKGWVMRLLQWFLLFFRFFA